ncbi:hypothetical protein GH740_02855 [Microbacterium sp. SYP-A9085]|uniref:hypothetical protein n=1 Tax=Microbacterium sp. SYP-A9085 TaxID=2664454 RepID=UPI00129B0A7A|nr:hypothetical protein [Microbacterium sp. SYP-A9085]MRH28253.1 hypothetical protein [Microbacterium sp. SYP-A9085]
MKGADFTEIQQSSQRAQIQDALSRALEAHGSAQLLFDGYDRALARSQGARLQAWLTNQLVDGVHARDIGAIFTARCSTAVHREGAGSPLMSRVTPILPPTLDKTVPKSESGKSWFGDAAVIADRVSSDGRLTPQVLIDQFEFDATYITDVRGAAQTQIERGTLDPIHDSYTARCAVHGLLHPGGKTRFLERLESALLASPESNPAWPEQASASVDRFVELISGADRVIWSDRYMYRDIEPLRSFLQAVIERSDAKIHLLGGREVSDRTVTRAEMARLTSLEDVGARWMSRSDLRDLHERHLVTGPGGWVVPQVHVIVGRQHPGSAVAARTSGFGVDYWTIWRRSIEPSTLH